MPFTMFVTTGTWHDHMLYSDEAIETIRRNRFLYKRDQLFASGLTGRQVQARANEIVGAFDAWQPMRDAMQAKLGCDELDQRHALEVERLNEIEDAISEARATTIEGLRIKAMVVVREGDREALSLQVAELILQLVPPATAVSIENATAMRIA